MKTVAIESPYRGDLEKHRRYRNECASFCYANGWAPNSSHFGLHTEVLDDNDPAQRTEGIMAGLAVSAQMDERIFFTDYGWSDGMRYARRYYVDHGLSWREMKIK